MFDKIYAFHLLNNSGEIVYTHDTTCDIDDSVLSFIKLLSNKYGIKHNKMYKMNTNTRFWAFMIFNSIIVILLLPNYNDTDKLRSLIIPVGKRASIEYKNLSNDIINEREFCTNIDILINKYIILSGKRKRNIDKIIDNILTNPGISYSGIISAAGVLISGNIPKTHMFPIISMIHMYGTDIGTDIMPEMIKINGNNTCLMRCNDNIIVVSSYNDTPFTETMKITSDIVYSMTVNKMK